MTSQQATRRKRPTPRAGPEPHDVIRVALLTRISTDEVNQPYSLEAQATRLDQFVASQPSMRITHRFTDQASGATLERPGLQQALDLARAGAFDVLLVYRIDRLSRSIVGLMTVVEQLEQAGVALKSATEPIDTQGPVGRMLLQLLGIFAEFERSMLIDRITAGFERKAARGEWLGGRGPYGYDLDKNTKTLVVNHDEAAVVQAVFAKYVTERHGGIAIANWLSDTGRRTKYGGLWSGQTVLRVLRNPVYIGKISHDSAIHEGKHDAIVDPALFDRAQAILNERSAQPTPTTATTDYLLSGLTRCTDCQGAYIGQRAHGRRGPYPYYVCRSRATKGARACTGSRIPAKELEKRVIDSLLTTYDDLDLFEEAIGNAVTAIDDRQPQFVEELTSTEAQLRDTTAAIDRYLHAFETGGMPETVCAPRLDELAERRQELLDHRDDLAARVNGSTVSVPERQALEAVGDLLRETIKNGTPAVIKDTLASLIATVNIGPGRQANPFFFVPQTNTSPTPETHTSQALGTPVRMDPRQVELWGIEPQASSMRPRRSTN